MATETIDFKIKEGNTYVLRNGLITHPLKYSHNKTNYIFEGNVQEPEHKTLSVFHWKANGKFLVDSIDNRFDIIKENK